MLLKLYDMDWNFKGILWKEVKDISTFSAQENWSNWKLTISINQTWDLLNFQIWDEIKYYQNNELLFYWNILEIEFEENISYNFIKLNCVSIWNFITNWKINKNYDDTLENIVSDLITNYNNIRNKEVLKLWNIINTGNIQIQIWEKNYLDYFKEAAKKANQNFFIDKNWYINFSEWEPYRLFFAKEIENIKNIQTSSYIVNIQDIVNSISVRVNKNYNYYKIKPLDKIQILNSSKYNDTYKVSKISYWKRNAEVELENFISFTKLLWD